VNAPAQTVVPPAWGRVGRMGLEGNRRRWKF